MNFDNDTWKKGKVKLGLRDIKFCVWFNVFIEVIIVGLYNYITTKLG
jgi:hypothetical protein